MLALISPRKLPWNITTSGVTGSSTTFNLYMAGSSQIAVQQGLDIAVA